MEKSVNIFRFKKFDVINERSAMKVNTDGVLLGAAMTIGPDDRKLLDIGTGTGTIALMAAQRLMEWGIPGTAGNDAPAGSGDGVVAGAECDVWIDAIDVDEPSISEAAVNFWNSPWKDVLRACHLSLQEFSEQCEGEYDLIFSNPPYFEDSLTAPDERKSTARHTSEGLSYRDIFDFAAKRLSRKGRVSLVLPADQETAVCRYARMSGLHLRRILRIRTVPRKNPTRMIVEFSRQRVDEYEDGVLTIQDGGSYTQEYLSLMKDFYLFA